MKELFGIPMTTIMIVMLALLGICLAVVALIALTNRTMMRMGLRNIPRRRAQSGLVVVGLMLSTLIISAAFTTGDSLNYSITRDVYTILGHNDEILEVKASTEEQMDSASPYVPVAAATALEQRFADDPDIDGVNAAIFERVPVFSPDTRLSEPRVALIGLDPSYREKFGGVKTTDNQTVDINALPQGSVYLNTRSADLLEAKEGSTVQITVRNQPYDFKVAGILKPELMTGWQTSGPGTRDTGGVIMSLASAQQLLNRPGQVNFIGISNTGGIRDSVQRTDTVMAKLEPLFEDPAQRAALGFGDFSVSVDPSKQDGVDEAEAVGNLFTTFFIVLGLFSIAAGTMLIFMIFVMLAAERKAEMGMARAVGLKRRNLIQSFVSEGMAYDLMSGVVGAAVGVFAAWLLVVVFTRILFGDSFTMDLQVTPRSLVISYALGVVITFITVAFSSWRVSKLNIVAAIRDISEDRAKRAGKGSLIWGIILSVISVLLLLTGLSNNNAFAFYLGGTVLLLAVSLILRFFGAPPRPVFTIAGALIFAFWSLPDQWSDALFGQLDGDIEMFFLSGIGMVIGSTLVLVFNARLLTNLFQGGKGNAVWIVPGTLLAITVALAVVGIVLDGKAGDVSQLLYMAAGVAGMLFVVSLIGNRAQRFGPALKMAIAYPLSNRFRTGMTIAMFSLIVFSITVMSSLTSNFAALFVTDTARAGWDIVAQVNPNNPIPDFRAALSDAGFENPDRLQALGRTSNFSVTEVREPDESEFDPYPVIAGDDGFFQTIDAKMLSRAAGYADDRAVWDAVRTGNGLAVVDGLTLMEGFGAGPDQLILTDQIKRGDLAFEPFQLEVQDPVTGKTSNLTIIGVVDDVVSFNLFYGIYVSQQTYTSLLGPVRLDRVYVQLAPGLDSDAVNKEIKAALVTRGVDATDIRSQLEEDQELQVGFTRIFQGFMALGLFVGVAALGVIAFRSVVERRQQIGMLRALGFQKGTVALSFILESTFISVMGVLGGLIGAAILSRNLIKSDEFTDSVDIAFTIPWFTVIGFLVAGVGFALLMTYWPARKAASVPIAEALRYE